MKHKILYIDDEEINLALFKSNFNRFFEIVTTTSPLEGLEILKTDTETRIVIVDMRMPDMDGVTFVKKAIEFASGNVYYILTGYDIDKKISDAIKEGIVKQFFMKPFDVETILLAVNQVFED